MITEDVQTAENFSHYFANITESLGISEDQSLLSRTNWIHDPEEKAIQKYENRPCIKMIKERCELSQFEFKLVTVNEILEQIQKLNTNKVSPLTLFYPGKFFDVLARGAIMAPLFISVSVTPMLLELSRMAQTWWRSSLLHKERFSIQSKRGFFTRY